MARFWQLPGPGLNDRSKLSLYRQMLSMLSAACCGPWGVSLKRLSAAGAVAVASAAVVGPTPAHSDPAGLQAARLVGRFSVAKDFRASFEWPGSAIEFTIRGGWIELTFADTGNNSMVVDNDGVISRLDLKKGTHAYRVALGTAKTTHLVRFVRRTEASFGTTTLTDAATDGAFLPTPEKSRSILVIGDSISAGYGVEGTDTSCPFSADTQNQYLTYGAVTARRFDADVITLAISGIGLVQNYDGNTKITMPALMTRVLPSRPDTRPLPKTDAVVVHLGTNDFHAGRQQANFANAYGQLLRDLRANAPDAMLYAAMGPLLKQEEQKAAMTAIAQALAGRQAAGDRKVAMISFGDPKGVPSRGCDWHPNAASHRYMSDQLTSLISKDLGWRPVN